MANRKMNPNSLANLKEPWSATNRPTGKPGRKPSSIKKYIKDNNLNYNDITQLAKFILPMNEFQVKAVVKDPKVPIIIRCFARAVLSDLTKGNLDNVTRILERAVGKPKEHIEMVSENLNYSMNISTDEMTEEEAKEVYLNSLGK